MASLDAILKEENASPSFSAGPPLPANTDTPPFVPSATADAPEDALPFHWLEIAELLLDAAPDDIREPDSVRRLMRDLREARMAKIRAGSGVLEGGGEVKMNGVGGMEVSEGKAFICGVVDGLRYMDRSIFSERSPKLTWSEGKLERHGSFRGRKERPKRGRMEWVVVMRTRMTWKRYDVFSRNAALTKLAAQHIKEVRMET